MSVKPSVFSRCGMASAPRSETALTGDRQKSKVNKFLKHSGGSRTLAAECPTLAAEGRTLPGGSRTLAVGCRTVPAE
jgi:hypothetical protein